MGYDFGFNAYAVGQALNPLLEKIDFYLQNNNIDEAILICRALIETIPDEWKNLANMEERINHGGSDYRKEDAAMSKIQLLQKAGLDDEAESAITEYIRFKGVRKLRMERLVKEKQYADAIELI